MENFADKVEAFTYLILAKFESSKVLMRRYSVIVLLYFERNLLGEPVHHERCASRVEAKLIELEDFQEPPICFFE